MKQDRVRSLAGQFGTPLYAYDLAAVAERAVALKASLPEGAQVFFSFKANPLPALARELRRNGCRAEVTSTGELKAAQTAGFRGEEMLFGGPGKTEREINAALAAGIRWFSSESWIDLARIADGAKGAGCDVQILLRVNPSDPPVAGLAMTGVESQFGMDEEAWCAGAKPLPEHVHVRGVHVYFGTQVTSVEALVQNTGRAIQAAGRIADRLNFRCEIVNAGGGFPWPYGTNHAAPDLTGLREAISEVWAASQLSRGGELWFESGRHLVASSATLVSRVLDVKLSRTKRFVVLDTGIHHLGGMSGLGRIPRATLTFCNLTREESGEATVTDVVGPLCSPLDSLARGVSLGDIKAGDLLAIPNVGAYSLTASLIGFLNHPAPLEVAFRDGEVVEVWRWNTGHTLEPPTIQAQDISHS
jgi:diaminopimelate decarboxylase